MFENLPNFNDNPDLPPSQEQISKVSDERRGKYLELFGACPEQVAIKKQLLGIWPNGGVMEFEAPKLDMRVTVTFGLSNLDMPARDEPLEFDESIQDGKSIYKITTRTISEPMPSIPGRAGYGYEIVCLSRDVNPEPTLSDEGVLLMEFASAQLLAIRSNQLDTLDRSEARLFTITDGNNRPEAFYMMAKCWDILPSEFNLSNGAVSLLAMIKLHPREYKFAVENGPKALLSEFKKQSILPIGDDQRRSAL